MIKRIISLILITIIGTYMGFTSKDKTKTSLNDDLNLNIYSVSENTEKLANISEITELNKEPVTDETENKIPTEQSESISKSKNIGNIESKTNKTNKSTNAVSDNGLLSKTDNKDISQTSDTVTATIPSATQVNINLDTSEPERIVKKPTNSELEYIAAKVFERINIERQKKGVSALVRKEILNNAAIIRAKEIISKFGHTRPSGKSFYTVLNEVKYGEEVESHYFFNGEEINEIVYDFGAAGENITTCNHIMSWNTEIMPGFTGSEEELNRVADYISTAFINSPSHYNTMIDKSYTSVGISVSYTVMSSNNPDKKAIRFYCEEIFTTK